MRLQAKKQHKHENDAMKQIARIMGCSYVSSVEAQELCNLVRVALALGIRKHWFKDVNDGLLGYRTPEVNMPGEE